MKLTARARVTFTRFLQDTWDPTVTNVANESPYNICSFPQTTLSYTKKELLLLIISILQWRAGFLDYVSDICDVIGEPDLNTLECISISELLRPSSGSNLHNDCSYCMSEHETDTDCLLVGYVRDKWPDLPF